MIEFSAFNYEGDAPRPLVACEHITARVAVLIIGAGTLALWGAIGGAVWWLT